MPDGRRRAANRANAARSTGPSSVEGRRTASRNALKHGLGAAPAPSPGQAAALRALAGLLAAEKGPAFDEETVLRAAESLLDICRIRAARHLALLAAMASGGDVSALSPFDRYERRALSRRKRLLRASGL